MNITINQVHEACKNYFDLSSSESKKPFNRVCLTGLKALSMLTILIPVFIGLTYVLTGRVKQEKKVLDANFKKINSRAQSHFSPKIAVKVINNVQTILEREFPDYSDMLKGSNINIQSLDELKNQIFNSKRRHYSIDMGFSSVKQGNFLIFPKTYSDVQLFNEEGEKLEGKKTSNFGEDDTYKLEYTIKPGEICTFIQTIDGRLSHICLLLME